MSQVGRIPGADDGGSEAAGLTRTAVLAHGSRPGAAREKVRVALALGGLPKISAAMRRGPE